MAPHTTSVALTIGDWSIDTQDDARTEVLALDTRRGLDDGETLARVLLSVPPAASPSLLTQATGAAAGAAAGALGLGGAAADTSPTLGHVRGKDVRAGATLTVTLGVGDRRETVLTARVASVEAALGTMLITARGPLERLAALRVTATFENRTVAQIVRDLAERADVDVGDLATGERYPYILIDPALSVREQLRRLACREGTDLGVDADGRLTMTRFSATRADHVVRYGVHLLDARLTSGAPADTTVVVAGDGAAGAGGSERWHWLLADGASARAEAGTGVGRFTIADGAARSRDAADRLARRLAGAFAEERARGRLMLPGAPEIHPGSAIAIESAPAPGLQGVLKVLAVHHRYDKRGGFVTTLDVARAANGGETGGLLGAAAGALGGMLA